MYCSALTVFDKKILLVLFVIFFCFAELSFSQQVNPSYYTCVPVQENLLNLGSNLESTGGYKPAYTDYSGVPADAIFPVMIVFVQFANDPGPEADYWPRGEAPEFLNSCIANDKKYPVNGEWWDTYIDSTEYLSDYWMEFSRGHFHIVGHAYSVILDHEYQYYQTTGGAYRINDDIYAKLRALNIDWTYYDRWKTIFEGSSYVYYYEPDGFVDMIYKVFRSHAPGLSLPAGGTASLGFSFSQGEMYMMDSLNKIIIDGGYSSIGSGITLTPGHAGTEGQSDYSPYAPLTKKGFISFSSHEHGHYLFGIDHSTYGKMSGSGAPYGADEFLSPWESIYLGYIHPTIVNYNNPVYSLGDYSSRNSSPVGEVLQVPVNDPNEFFLIANRRKVSNYDRIMWGDTARGDPYRDINPSYGKGVYIYHIHNGYTYPQILDQECADGLYQWQYVGDIHPDWSTEQLVPYYIRTDVSYINDASSGRMNATDGKSIFTWFSIGQKNYWLNGDGMDRIYTNRTDIWTSREFQGDRWDAWNTGYNELFSPYSSPSTIDWNNNYSGVFIWLSSSDTANNTVSFKIYKAGVDGYTESDILALTPPSRPMGLTISTTPCVDQISYPVLSWKQNMEPDMVNDSIPGVHTKRYNIYRALPTNSIVPKNYRFLQTVDIDSGSIPQFEDTKTPISCNSDELYIPYVRYVITAVDNTGWESVKSDFVSTALINNDPPPISGFLVNTLPDKYNLYQNYPNPFNPVTQIKFDIPRGGIVKLSIYNMLGQLVDELVNGYRAAGRYAVSFDGSKYASGIYIYHIESGSFIQSKKMVLVK